MNMKSPEGGSAATHEQSREEAIKNFLENCTALESRAAEDSARRIALDSERERRQTEEILSRIESWRGKDKKPLVLRKDISTNGYWFRFSYRGIQINFVNQEDRLCVEMYRAPISNEEKVFFAQHESQLHQIAGGPVGKKFQELYSYKDLVIDGSLEQALEKIKLLADDMADGTSFADEMES